MYLSHLELQGFKSFAKKTTLQFAGSGVNGIPGITAVVGPNGAGKSNIADGIRWVLGEQSLKLLRGKKAEDVIFSGSDARARLGFAEVALTFTNHEASTDLPMSEVVITRRLFRDGTSEYRINGAKVRLQDIQIFLAKANIGQRTYAVIGQGMIEHFIVATPPERKVLFDEATGVRPYEIKRDQAVLKLDRTKENLTQALATLQELEPRLRTLERQVKRWEHRAEMERELKNLQQTLYDQLWSVMNKNWLAINQQTTAAETRCQEQTQTLKTIQTQLERLEQEHAGEVRDDAFRALQKTYEQTVEERQKSREALLRLEHARELQSRLAVVQPTAVNLHDVLTELEHLKSEHEQALQALDANQDASKLKTIFQSVGRAIHNLIERIRGPKPMPPKMNEPSTAEKNLQKLIGNLTEQINKTSNDLKNFQQQEQASRSEVFKLQHDFQRAQLELNQRTARLNELNIERARLETHRTDLEREIVGEMGAIPHLNPPPSREEGGKNLINESETRATIARLKRQLELIGAVDEETLNEYKEVAERTNLLQTQTTDLEQALTQLTEIISELDATIETQFNNNFHTINTAFQKYFTMLFNGGKAELVLVTATPTETDDETDPAEKNSAETKRGKVGIDIRATPPGKRITHLATLSGGERTMTAIALLCAIIATNPAPFVVLDEVDAALDEANAIRFGAIIAELQHHTQFIIITHNRYTMECATILYGVTMGDDGISQLLSIMLASTKRETAAATN